MRAITASPTMVGAITTLIVIVAVFLAYNANNGLPFVPTYQVSVDIPNGSRLVNNNEVRIGGTRVGVVQSIEAVRVLPEEGEESAQGSASDAGGEGGRAEPSPEPEGEGEVIARLQLRLDENAGPIPKDSVFRVRYRSSFGLKFLEITRGDGEPAPEGFQFNGTNDVADPDAIPLTLDEASKLQELERGRADGVFVEQTEFDDISNTFNQRTRAAGRQNLVGFGTAFAGRGASLNQALEALNPLFRGLKPVARTLIARDTRLRRFFPELADASRIVAPVAFEQAELFTNMAIAFGAISEDPEALKETISEGPPTLRTGIETLPRQRPFLIDFTTLSNRLRPGVSALRAALPSLNSAVRVGTRVLPRTVGMNRRLRKALVELERLVEQPSTRSTLLRLRETFGNAKPLAQHVAPTQTVCNYWNYWFTLLPEHLTERDQVGYNQRVSIINPPPGDQHVAVEVAPGVSVEVTVPGEVKAPLAGYSGRQSDGISSIPGEDGVFKPHEFPILHGPPYGPGGQPGTNDDCQSGQTGYPLGAGLEPTGPNDEPGVRVKGQPLSNPAVASSDIPGSRGVTDVFWFQDSTRVLRDTRVESRQP